MSNEYEDSHNYEAPHNLKTHNGGEPWISAVIPTRTSKYSPLSLRTYFGQLSAHKQDLYHMCGILKIQSGYGPTAEYDLSGMVSPP